MGIAPGEESLGDTRGCPGDECPFQADSVQRMGQLPKTCMLSIVPGALKSGSSGTQASR